MGTKLLTIDKSAIRMKLREPLIALCLLALSVGSSTIILPGTASAQQTDQTMEADKGNADVSAVDEEWREAFLRELSAVATKLERQRKFNEMLRDRIDILNHRIETLENENKEQSARLKALGEETTKPADTHIARKSAPEDTAGDKERTEQSQTPSLAPAPKDDADQQAAAPQDDKNKAKNKNKDSEEKSAKRLPDDFNEFLDMGEAMMRRFFGVVKEFRQEFEDNRV